MREVLSVSYKYQTALKREISKLDDLQKSFQDNVIRPINGDPGLTIWEGGLEV